MISLDHIFRFKCLSPKDFRLNLDFTPCSSIYAFTPLLTTITLCLVGRNWMENKGNEKKNETFLCLVKKIISDSIGRKGSERKED